MASYGPAKPCENDCNTDSDDETISSSVKICKDRGPFYKKDPSGRRTGEDKDTLDPLTAQLWWAGKELMRDKKLSDHVGKNDKTMIIVKLQEKGRGAPPREPPIDAETQKAMMAWYHKRQQEQKKLGEEEDDRYTNLEWANTRSLEAHFQGTSHIRYR